MAFPSRWIHPRDAKDPWDTFEVAEALHATDFVWTYSLDGQAVGGMKQFGGKVFLAINSLVPDEPGGSERLQGRILDLDGNRVTAPWMRNWKGRYWGCANSPQYRSSYEAYAKRAVDAGTDGLQMDDPPMNVAALRWGGCLCPHCMAEFREQCSRIRLRLPRTQKSTTRPRKGYCRRMFLGTTHATPRCNPTNQKEEAARGKHALWH